MNTSISANHNNTVDTIVEDPLAIFEARLNKVANTVGVWQNMSTACLKALQTTNIAKLQYSKALTQCREQYASLEKTSEHLPQAQAETSYNQSECYYSHPGSAPLATVTHSSSVPTYVIQFVALLFSLSCCTSSTSYKECIIPLSLSGMLIASFHYEDLQPTIVDIYEGIYTTFSATGSLWS